MIMDEWVVMIMISGFEQILEDADNNVSSKPHFSPVVDTLNAVTSFGIYDKVFHDYYFSKHF